MRYKDGSPSRLGDTVKFPLSDDGSSYAIGPVVKQYHLGVTVLIGSSGYRVEGSSGFVSFGTLAGPQIVRTDEAELLCRCPFSVEPESIGSVAVK